MHENSGSTGNVYFKQTKRYNSCKHFIEGKKGHCSTVAWGGATREGGGGAGPPNNFDRHVLFGELPRSSRCSSVKCLLFIYGVNDFSQLKIAGN